MLNYLVYPLISNIVDIKTFGEIQFLFTAFNQLSLGFVVLNILSILATAKSKDKKEEKKRILSLNMIASLVAGVISIVGVAVLIVFKSQLQLHNTTAIILLGVGLLVNVPFTITIGQLQGNSRFLQSGVISLMATFLKLVLSIVFVKIGLGATGAMLGVVIGMLISTLVGLWLNSGLKVKAKDADISSISFLKKPAIYSLILIGTLTIASSLDLLVARTILTQTDAGIYSGVATISKIILAVLSPIICLSIPLAVKGDKKTTYKYLLISILLAVCFFILGMMNPIFLLLALAMVAAAYFVSLNAQIEYEYLYCERELSVDKIMNKSKRKNAGKFEVERMEILAPMGSYHLDEFKNKTYKELDFSSGTENKPEKRYVLYYDGKDKVVLEPNEEIIKAIKSIAPRKVFTD